MNQSRLGCFAPTGIIAAVLTTIIVATVTFAQGGVLFNPGPLNAQAGTPIRGATSHAEIGVCATCHAPFWDASGMAARCMNCHTNIADQKSDPNSLHNVLLQSKLSGACRTCHPEHRGQDAPLTVLDTASFPHEALGFPLVGKHSSLECAACHINNQYHPLPTDCFSCHTKDDTHAGQFGTDCSLCHSPAGWKPATFDHNLAIFKLDGKHAAVPCTSCHVNGIFKGTPTDCFACHAKDDPHGGRFGTTCSACHTTSGWLPATFDHSRSAFPLTGAHAALDCTRCHKGNVFAGTPAFCAGCHGDPAFHAGMFTGTSCETCHNTSFWSPANYNSPHPGGCEGNCLGHEGATCRDCHTANLATATCTKCHDSNTPGDGGGGGDDD
jgi:Class III cytochrome C family